MRLKSLKLSGFKSFANPTTFTFRHGITAIVGPNGCGKSNVIDAIRWVLGESSAKQLRGGAMSDVIFSGTQSKAAKSLASVELTFEHTQDEQTGIRHELNLYHELSVRRQINAEGKSDYFINGTRCRRRDVVDVFLGTGLGPRSYSVIQQGMIGRIVDSSPLQLREFIEEAAGVSRYQVRREETQKKLFKTRENLERLNDIELELTRQKQKLSKQAESAKNYQHVKEELSQVKEQLAIYQLYQAKAAQIEHKKEQEALAKTLNELQEVDAKIKQKLSKISARLSEEQWLKDEARDKLHQQDMQRQQAEHKLNTLRSSINQLQSRLQSNLEKQKRTQVNSAIFEQQHEESATTLARLMPEINVLQTQQQQTLGKYAPLQSAWEASSEEVAKIEAKKRVLEQHIALDKQALARVQQDLSKWETRQQLWQQAALKWGIVSASPANSDAASHHQNNIQSAATLDANIAHIDAELKSLDKQQDSINETLDAEQPLLTQLEQSLNEQRSQSITLEKQHASLMAEYDTLHGIVHPPKADKHKDSHEKMTNKTGDINSGKNSSQSDTYRVLDNLALLHEQIKLTKAGESYAKVLDKWLAFWLDTHVLSVDSIDSTDDKEGTGWNGPGNEGHGSQDSLSSLLTHLFNVSDNTPNDKSSTNGANSIFFERKIESDEKSEPPFNHPLLIPLSRLIAAPQLSIWQHCYLYNDSTDKESANNDSSNSLNGKDNFSAIKTKAKTEIEKRLSDLIVTLPNQAIVLTPSGWLIGHAGALHISKFESGVQNEQFLSVRLQQKKRLDVLEDALNDVESRIESQAKSIKVGQAKQEQMAVITQELSEQLSAVTQKRHELRQQRVELIAKQERQLSEQQRLNEQRTELDLEYDDIQQSLTQLTQKVDANNDNLVALIPTLEVAKNKQQQLEQQKSEISQQERDASEKLRQIQLKISQAEIAQKHNSEQLKQLTADLVQLKHTHQKLTQESNTAQGELPKLEAALKACTVSHHELQVALDERNAIIGRLQTEVNECQVKRDSNEKTLQQIQDKLAQSITQVAIANERIKEASERLTALNTDISPSALLTDYIAHGRSVSEDKLQKLQSDAGRLTAKLDNMGPVNLAAAAELAAVDERLIPLKQQISDIKASMDTLTDAMASIDNKTKILFLDTLASVNESLTTLFTKVFGGGQASLTLVKDDGLEKGEQWRAGIELMAQPKGKKNSRLAVLSGGEKTLTALSLIFAIFKQHPAPFCVLDEVDAPLDDANVVRFTNLIRELACDVQFIFISHNKLAMQIADELKGITMPQAGISTLVSVSLEEAERYLEPTA